MEMAAAKRQEASNHTRDEMLQAQLHVRRQKLNEALPHAQNRGQLTRLLQDVDAALDRMEAGTFGVCERCRDPIENDRLLADPLCRNCLDHLSPAEQRALERDLDLAFQIQQGLLPKPGFAVQGWSMAYHYQPLGPVSGDYCDLIVRDGGAGLFLLGDVMGKGVAASMLMAHLHAIFRSLIDVTPHVNELVAKANRIFCEGTLSTFFATLVCGSLRPDGEVEICNAGHCYPLHVHDGRASRIEATGLPLGLFSDGDYRTHVARLAPGDTLVVHSDGLSEATNGAGQQFGVDRLVTLLQGRRTQSPKAMLADILNDLEGFRGAAPGTDDLTVMVLRREV